MKRTLAVAGTLVIALLLAFWLGGDRRSVAAAAPPPAGIGDGIVVEGTGQAAGAPDVLRATFGVSGSGPDVTAALNAASAQIARVHQQLVQDGTRAADLQTSDVSIYPGTTKHGRRYQVSETLTAKLRDLKRAGAVLSHAVAVGGPGISLQDVSFALEDNTALLDKARAAAFADARHKAEGYAKLSGLRLGKVLLVSEVTQDPQVDKQMAADGAAGLALTAPVPVYSGTSALTVTVTVRWALAS